MFGYQSLGFGVGSSVAASTLLTSLVSWWSLDEASGSRADSHGSNTLTDNNTVTQATGKVSNAGQFTYANSEWLSKATPTGVNGGNTDWTIQAWVYADSFSGGSDKFPGIVILGGAGLLGAGDNDYLLVHDNGDTFEFFSSNGSSFSLVSATNFGAASTATWYHIIAWHDSAVGSLNIKINDGTTDTNSSINTPSHQASADNLQIGRYDVHWDGRIDEVAFWSRVLTASEITELYNSGSGIAYPG